MKLNALGGSGLRVSKICLGTMTWGEQTTEAEGHAQIDWALEHGINFIDTAEMYPIPPAHKTQGATEKIIGATSLEQLDELSRHFDLVLAPEVLSDLEEVNKIYPSPCAQ